VWGLINPDDPATGQGLGKRSNFVDHGDPRDYVQEYEKGVNPMKKDNKYLIPGFHAVREVLLGGKIKIHELLIGEGKRPARMEELISMARDRDIPLCFVTKEELNKIVPNAAHQAIMARTEEFPYADLDEIIDAGLNKRGKALLIVADHITDEGNLGALIRSAAFFGSDGLIIPKDRSAQVSPSLLKRSSGAFAYLPIARVVNLARTLDLLNKRGFWIMGASGNASKSIYKVDWNLDIVLVLGNEKKGISRVVEKQCQQMVRIPRSGRVDSLNVSVAGGVIMSEIVRQRA
jgi:23S rRNA (guanosine2251-2'-O)-methyltransferase